MNPRVVPMAQTHYLISPSLFGNFGIIWRELDDQPGILRVTLPGKTGQLEAALRDEYPLAAEGVQTDLEALAGDIRRFLAGEDVHFDLQWLAWENCTAFQSRVLSENMAFPGAG